MDSIATDRNRPSCVETCRAFRIYKMDNGFVRVLFNSDTSPVEYYCVQAESLPNFICEHGVKIAAMNGYLRPRVPGGSAPRLSVNSLPEARVEAKVLNKNSLLRESIAKPQARELLNRVRQQIETNPQRL
jgi:hypothetical protein